jgi:hypothetical protein
LRDDIGKGPLRDFRTGTGGACAPLSGSQKPSPAARVCSLRQETNYLALLASVRTTKKIKQF